MITIKLLNIIHQGRKNQNTTFNIFAGDYGLKSDVTEKELLENIENIKPEYIKLQKNSSLKIIYRRQ